MRHEPGQTAPNPPPVAHELPAWQELSDQQVTALDLLVAGLPVTRVASRLNLHRATIHRWKTQHPAFIAAMNRRRQESLDALASHCTQLLTDAVGVLEGSLARRRRIPPQRHRTALAVLRTFGTRRLLLAPGPTTPDSALRQIAVQRRIELNEPLNNPITYKELQNLRDELRLDILNEPPQPLPPCDTDALSPADPAVSPGPTASAA